MSKINWGGDGKSLLNLIACSPSSREVRTGTQVRILDVGTVAEAMEECC